MDKKELKKITTKIYEEYGFVKKGKYYYLDLPDVVLCSGFFTVNGIMNLSYNFSLKAVNTEESRKPNNMFDGYDSIEIKMNFNPMAQGYHKHEICVDTWTEDFYVAKLKEVLHYYFDPYKKDALNYIKRASKEAGLVNDGEIILLSIKARQFLELYKDKSCMIEFDGELSKGVIEKVTKRYYLNMVIIMFIACGIVSIPVVLLGIFFYPLVLIFLIVYVAIFIGGVASTKENVLRLAPTTVKINKNEIEITQIRLNSGTCRTLDDVKKVLDYGDYYRIDFYVLSKKVLCICEKANIKQGSIEEFEELFKDYIVRKIK